jgi:D-beta-D-heptose 7-phosphate kinase/D-beta-D-heptose 1-phosphate adenosyltransferase
VITPNTSEAEALSGIRIHDYESLYQSGYKILEDSNCKTVIITRGKDGMAIFSRGEDKPILIPTFAREVFDVSGAGDTTIAMLALASISGADMVEAALLANSAAGIVVGKRGTATTTSDEVAQYVDLLNRLAKKKEKKLKGQG